MNKLMGSSFIMLLAVAPITGMAMEDVKLDELLSGIGRGHHIFKQESEVKDTTDNSYLYFDQHGQHDLPNVRYFLDAKKISVSGGGYPPGVSLAPGVDESNFLHNSSVLSTYPDEVVLRHIDEDGKKHGVTMHANTGDIISTGHIVAKGFHADGGKLVDIADGEISPTSKEAINGSQLYKALQRLGGIANEGNTVNTGDGGNTTNISDGGSASNTGDGSSASNTGDGSNGANTGDGSNTATADDRGRTANAVNYDAIGANSAALAALHPLPYTPDSKFHVALGYGKYKSESAMALGVFYTPNASLMVSTGIVMGAESNQVYNVGLSYRFGKASHHDVTASTPSKDEQLMMLEYEVKRLQEENKKQVEINNRLEMQLEKVLAYIEK